MNEKIFTAFDDIHMSDACGDRILDAMQRSKRRTRGNPRLIRLTAAAACLMAAVLLLCNPTVVAALENTFASVLEKYVETRGESPEEEITVIRYQSPEGKFYSEDVYRADGSLVIGRGGNDLTKLPEWYVEQDERVYFAGNGEWIDVTDLISMDNPFTYIYTDQGGIIHYIAIGGVYDPDPEKWNVGYAEWYYDPDFVDELHGIRGHWAGGYCDNYWNKDTDDDWPWLAKAKEDMGIPWK